jgi:hypothetical protein
MTQIHADGEKDQQAIPYEREHALPILYRCRRLITTCRVDFVCYAFDLRQSSSADSSINLVGLSAASRVYANVGVRLPRCWSRR